MELIAETKAEEDVAKVVEEEGRVVKEEGRVVQEEQVNIVKAKLEGTGVMVFTEERNVTKSITVVVKSLLINHKESIIIDVEINRDIDTLKKMIFQHFGESVAHYSNLKLFTLVPTMAELTVTSKTIIQCQIKHMAKIVLMADYAFTFRAPQKMPL